MQFSINIEDIKYVMQFLIPVTAQTIIENLERTKCRKLNFQERDFVLAFLEQSEDIVSKEVKLYSLKR